MTNPCLTVLLLFALVDCTAGQGPCKICGPQSSDSSCTPQNPMPAPLPEKLQVQSSICTEIETNYKDYHNLLCEKYPKPNGYYYECTTPGTSNTFSCRSSCGPPLEDVGKGLNLDLLKGGGLFGSLNKQYNNQNQNLFDFNNFNNDQDKNGNADFGNFATLGSFGGSGGGRNTNRNLNSLNLFGNQGAGSGTAAAAGNGNFNNNLLNQGQASNVLGGASSTANNQASSGGSRTSGGNTGGTNSFSSTSSTFSDQGGNSKSGNNLLNFGNTGSSNNQGLANFGNSVGNNQALNVVGNSAGNNQAVNFAGTTAGNNQALNNVNQGLLGFGDSGLGLNQAAASLGTAGQGATSSSNGNNYYGANVINNGINNFDTNARQNNRASSSGNNNAALQDIFGTGQTQSGSSSGSSSGSGGIGGLNLFAPVRRSQGGAYNPFNLAGGAQGDNSQAFNFAPSAGALPPSSFGGGLFFGGGRGPSDVTNDNFRQNFDVTVLKPVSDQRSFDNYFNNFNNNFQNSFDNLLVGQEGTKVAGTNPQATSAGVPQAGASVGGQGGASAATPQGGGGGDIVPLQHSAHEIKSEGALQAQSGPTHASPLGGVGNARLIRFQPMPAGTLIEMDDVRGQDITERPPGIPPPEGKGGDVFRHDGDGNLPDEDNPTVRPKSPQQPHVVKKGDPKPLPEYQQNRYGSAGPEKSEETAVSNKHMSDGTATENKVNMTTTEGAETITASTQSTPTTTSPTTTATTTTTNFDQGRANHQRGEVTQQYPAVAYIVEGSKGGKAEVEDDVPLPAGADVPMKVELGTPFISKFPGAVVVSVEGEGQVL